MPPTRRTDGNHGAIAGALRQIGAVVLDVHTVAGCLDLLVAFRGTLYILECKDPDSWRGRQLTPAEQETIRQLAAVGVQAHVVRSTEDALRAIRAIL